MTYLDPPDSSGESADGAEHRRYGARHGGAAPEAYLPAYGDETLVFDQPLRTTEQRRGRAETRVSRAEDRRQRSAGLGSREEPTQRAGGAPRPLSAARDRSRAQQGHPGTARHGEPAGDTDPAHEDPAGSAGSGQRKPGRAGRNLPAAIGVGVSLGALVLASLLLWRPAFLAVLVAAVVIAIWEMTRALNSSGARPPLVPLLAGGVAMVVSTWFSGADALAVCLMLTVLAAMVWRLSDGPAGFQRDVTAAALITMYVPLLGGFAALLATAEDDGHFRVLVTLAAVVLSDTGGYAAGVFLGRHPMAPTVSPKKSWEGFGGSVLAAALGSGALLYWLLDVAPWRGAVFGAVLAGAAVLGDLAESMIKRDLKVKDMSSLLPGHGGLMDRLDSILFALPAAYLMLSLLVAPSG